MNVLKLLSFFILFRLLGQVQTVHAYTNFIGYGYTACITCHYNPFGNGPLNDYGRAIYATAIGGKLFYPGASEEGVSKYSGFFGPYKIPRVRPSINYRSLNFKRDYGGDNENSDSMVMTVDFQVAVLLGKQNQYKFVYGLSQYPKDRIIQTDTGPVDPEKTMLNREAYASWQVNPNYNVMLGLFDKVYGLRIPDHEAFSRSFPGVAENDQSMGAALHVNMGRVEAGINYFTGNPAEEENVKQKGLSGMAEIELLSKTRLGASFLTSSSETQDTSALAFHGRAAFGKGSSIIGEIGRVSEQEVTAAEATVGAYGFMQGMIRLFRGFHFLTTFEFKKSNINEPGTRNYRFGPGLQYFPVQRVELRMDLVNNRVVSPEFVNEDSWDLFLQTHLTF